MNPEDRDFMARAIALADEVPFTHPNPRVGAVVARGDRILSEGAHRGAGTPHAERLALEGTDAARATLYVTLEPCTHHGRTPPCAPFVVESGISRVVVGMTDPDERVKGEGIRLLREAGIEVEVGILENEARELNRAYVHHRLTGLPFVSLKLALSLDGRLAAPDGSSQWITGAEAREVVHRRRSRVDAVMVGAGTVLADDPSLTVRDVEARRQPSRIVVDSSGRVPGTAKVFSPEAKVFVATTRRSSEERRREWADAGAEVLVLDEGERGVDLGSLLKSLGSQDVIEILCEGGGELATSLLRRDLVDGLELNLGPLVLGRGGPEIGDLGISTLTHARRWKTQSVAQSGDDVLVSLLKEVV